LLPCKVTYSNSDVKIRAAKQYPPSEEMSSYRLASMAVAGTSMVVFSSCGFSLYPGMRVESTLCRYPSLLLSSSSVLRLTAARSISDF
jgi:hypothetical protein